MRDYVAGSRAEPITKLCELSMLRVVERTLEAPSSLPGNPHGRGGDRVNRAGPEPRTAHACEFGWGSRHYREVGQPPKALCKDGRLFAIDMESGFKRSCQCYLQFGYQGVVRDIAEVE